MQLSRWVFHHWVSSAAVRALQLSVFVLSGVLAVLLRFDFFAPPGFWSLYGLAVPIGAISKLVAFELFGLGRGAWRFISTPDLGRIVGATIAGAILGGAAILAVLPPGYPRSLYLLDLAIALLLTLSARVAVRMAYEAARHQRQHLTQRTIIYGAGFVGALLVRECSQNPHNCYSVVGFVDDDRAKVGTYIQGLRVLGTGDSLPVLVRRLHATLVLIAIPSATGAQTATILERCHAAGVRFRTIPSLSDYIEGKELAKQIRDVSLDDLLGRNAVHLEEQRIRAKLRGRSIMVTGAAGSIGSELCRQIARFEPACIIGFDISETGLFLIEAELRDSFPRVRFVSEIGSIQNSQRVQDVLHMHAPAVLYHAAAYKHVPLMEKHLFEAVENNVLGTYRLALAASALGVADFVMISSDKAVRPTSIMGVTKRIAELVVNSLSGRTTTFVSVRFGNVLGSNGSVVPVFKRQIEAGGPVTITHPEMRRYFMTIPEAAQLVLQSSTLGRGGEVFVLDMGEPVRIVDLARRLILLSGLRPGEDIRIDYVGIRPGEKLSEELSTIEESSLPTSHQKVKVFVGNGAPRDGMMTHIETLHRLCTIRDAQGLILEIKALVPEYNPSAQVLRQVLCPVMAQEPVLTCDDSGHLVAAGQAGVFLMHGAHEA